MFLEQWVQDKIRGNLPATANTKDTEKFQLLRLKDTLKYVYQNSSFYRKQFDSHGLNPDDIRSLNDLPKLPFTTESDMRDSPYKMLCVSLGDVQRVYTLNTGGTTGTPKRVFFSEEDLDRISDYMGAAMKTVAMLAGLDSGYTVVIFLPDGERSSQANLLVRGIQNYDGKPIKIDLSLSYEKHLDIIKESKPDIVFGSVPRLWKMTQLARQQGNDLSKIEARVLFLTSEYLPETMRQELRNSWRSDIYSHYGMTEMGFGGPIECNAHHGYHINEVDFLFEVIDPATGQNVTPGVEGELVFTTLTRLAMPLIRYRTGDLTSFVTQPCHCGASRLRRLDTVSKRITSLVRTASGDALYPSMFADALYAIPETIDYQPILSRERDKERLVVQIEVTRKEPEIQRALTQRLMDMPVIEKNAESGTMILEVELVAQGGLPPRGRAKRLIADQR